MYQAECPEHNLVNAEAEHFCGSLQVKMSSQEKELYLELLP